MARTSQMSVESAKPEVWIQYKATRARVLQTTKEKERSKRAPVILGEFRADLEALSMSVTGVPMDAIRIIWGTGQIRATYTFRTSGFCDTIKYLVKRACTTLSDTLAERSISRLYYAEGGTPLAMESLPAVPPSPNPPSIPHPLPNSNNAPHSHSTAYGPSDLQLPAASSEPRRSYGFKSQPAGPSSNISSTFLPPHDRQTLISHGDQPFSTPALDPFRDTLRPRVSSPPQRVIHSSTGKGHHILPPIFLSRGEVPNGFNPPPQPYHAPQETGNIPQAPAPPKIDTLRVPGGLARLRPQQMRPTVALTSGTCMRLRDRADDSVLSHCPVVRFLVLRGINPDLVGNSKKIFEAFITDGHGYTWVALASDLSGGVGDKEDGLQVQVGSVVKLKGMSRLSSPDRCGVLVHDFDLLQNAADAKYADDDVSAPPTKSVSPSTIPNFPNGPPAAPVLQSERAARLLAESKLQEERRRRVLLERVLADVCLDLDRTNSLAPAAIEALRKIDELAEAAMLVENAP